MQIETRALPLPGATQTYTQQPSSFSRVASLRSMASQGLREKWSQLCLCTNVAKDLLNKKKVLLGVSFGALGLGSSFLVHQKTKKRVIQATLPSCSLLEDPRLSRVSTSCEVSSLKEELEFCLSSDEENPSGICFKSEAPIETFFNEFWSWLLGDSSNQAIRTPLLRPSSTPQPPSRPVPVVRKARMILHTPLKPVFRLPKTDVVERKPLRDSEMVAWIRSLQDQDDAICPIRSKELVIFRA